MQRVDCCSLSGRAAHLLHGCSKPTLTAAVGNKNTCDADTQGRSAPNISQRSVHLPPTHGAAVVLARRILQYEKFEYFRIFVILFVPHFLFFWRVFADSDVAGLRGREGDEG